MTQTERPSIRLRHAPDAPAELVRAFEHGCEEEGVPAVGVVSPSGDADALARLAAQESALFIGAGIDGAGRIVLSEQRLGDRPPLLVRNTTTPNIAFDLGIAAGRIARGRPLPDVVVRDES